MSDERTVAQIREDIAQRREAVTSTARRLEERIKRKFDWRAHVTQHPIAAVSLAAAVGLAGVLMLRSRRRDPFERAAAAFAGMVADIRAQLGDGLEDLTEATRGTAHRHDRRPFSSGAVSAVATALAKVVVDLMDGRRAQRTRRDDGTEQGVRSGCGKSPAAPTGTAPGRADGR